MTKPLDWNQREDNGRTSCVAYADKHRLYVNDFENIHIEIYGPGGTVARADLIRDVGIETGKRVAEAMARALAMDTQTGHGVTCRG